MPIIPNLFWREALEFGSTAPRGIVDASAAGSYLKPMLTPGIVDHNSLFEFNAGHQNNGGRNDSPTLAARRAAEALRRGQPGGLAPVDDRSPGGPSYDLPMAGEDHPPLGEEDYRATARDAGISEVAIVKAVAQVESNAQAFLQDGRPCIRYEPHHFHHLTGGRYDRAFPALSSPYSIVKALHLSKGNQAGYAVLEMAMKLDADAAVQACSWGAFQVLGTHWRAAGFSSPHAMVREVYRGLRAHLRLFVGYIQESSLAATLNRKDWAGFARRYNGSNYAKTRYDVRLQESYEHFADAA